MVHRPHVLLLAMAAAVCMVGQTSSMSALAAPVASAPVVPVLHWVDCGDGFQCTTAVVPLDYNRPLGRSISLGLIRLPALDVAHRIGSLFINPGGPGGSGVAVVREAGHLFPPDLHSRFDLVGFDPRGVASSTPVQCFASSAEQQAFLSSLPPFPVTPNEEVAFIQAFRAFDARCAARNPDLLPHMSTANADRDLDLLRQAVGDKKLTYLGLSYGTYLGASYANLFPDRVRALVLDGAIEPVEWATGRDGEGSRVPFSTRLKSDLGAEKTLNAFLSLCAQAGPSGCAFATGNEIRQHEGEGLRHKFDALMARLLEHPLVLSTPQGQITITYAVAVSLVLGALYQPSVWPLLGAVLQELRLGTTGDHVVMLRQDLKRPAAQPYDNGFDAFASITCADTDNPHNPFVWPQAAHAADRRAPYFGSAWTYASMQCAEWRARDADRYAGPWNRPTSNPILVVGNLYDPATRYESAVSLSRLLARARLLTLDGWGHTALFKSACIDGAVIRYFLSTELPPVGTVCRPDRLPFGPIPPEQAERERSMSAPASVPVDRGSPGS